MPIGIVSDKDFEKEQSNIVTPISKPIQVPDIVTINKGRGNGNSEVPESLRKVISETAIQDGRSDALDLARQFGISSSSVSAYSRGANSTASYNQPTRELSNHIDTVKERISKRARNKLSLALKHITSDKLEQSKPTELASVAKDMSVIVKNMEPDTPENPEDKNKPQFIFYAPTFVKEEIFETVIAKE